REKDILRLVNKSSDFLVLSRYMLVLSANFIKSYAKDIINIHHGFLPSFKGKNPYQQVLEKGVKVIGATSHFVNERLDTGPIIIQKVEQISHKDDLKSLMLKGRNLETSALSDALRAYIDHRVIRFKNKTVIF
ncbi:MAG: formyltetrahydrofolate deformylase, partial [Candidatus Omnitrophica bacterium]|nr:formyltetrahydrofolate deformylase [Candidatus Omnitrophota bacterium]